MQVRRNSGAGALLGESENVTIAERPIIGGTLVIDETYTTHVFTTSGNLVVSSSLTSPIQANVLIVGGGGGTFETFPGTPVAAFFQRIGGGLGAGGFLEKEVTLDTSNSYSIIVGAGQYGNGNPSEAFGNVAYGGGGPGSPGGSGGSTHGWAFPNPRPAGGAGIQPTYGGYGFPSGSVPPSTTNVSSGGGGAGGTASGPNTRNGGIGRVSPLSPPEYGTPGPTPGRWFAGGGGGWEGSGGAGGGGANSTGAPVPSKFGVENTGGGGSGAHVPLQVPGGAGGSGIVIIRYLN